MSNSRGPKSRFDQKYARYLGVLPDREVAKMAGVSLASVVHQRRKLGVKAAMKARERWTEQEVALLGTMTDAALAEKLGRTSGWSTSKGYNPAWPALCPSPLCPPS